MRGPKTNTTTRARSLRRSDNVSEAKLWEELRARRLNGFKFVRQLPIGRYFADFACRDRKLVIEIDGSQHANSDYDRQRDSFMNADGWSVARFWNVAVLAEMESVLETIVAILEGRLNEPEDAPDLKFMPAAEG
ncbi:endonuclease domain-containing protein [Neorhizobium tomejilense]|uniref:endonuclease domain-containing protein n=1 Tax=Neorhizobium tomejilense TaxID=2093828 RepID=UPI003ECECD94